MRNLALWTGRPVSFLCAALAASLIGLVGCGDDDASGGTDSGTGGGGTDSGPSGVDAGRCSTAGQGSLRVTVNGLPSGVEASLRVTGPGDDQVFTESTSVSAASGVYQVSANIVPGVADPIVRKAYRPTLEGTQQTFCLGANQTATVTVVYSLIATSHHLWTGGEAAPMLGFDAGDLATSGSPEAAVKSNTRVPRDHTFDAEGNLWVIGGTTEDPTLNRYDADAVAAASGAAQAEITVQGDGCSPGASALAFDATGNLWVAVTCADSIVRLSPEEIASSGTITPSFAITGVTAPKGLAFDAAGNLWVANDDILRFDAGSLASADARPALTLSLSSAVEATSATADALAFDASGNLWASVSANYNFAMLAPAVLEGTGRLSVAPSVHISVGVDAIPSTIAFDDSGALWFAQGAGTFSRLNSDQLGTNSTYSDPTSPAVRITSPDVGFATAMAFYPAAAGLPLFHSMAQP